MRRLILVAMSILGGCAEAGGDRVSTAAEQTGVAAPAVSGVRTLGPAGEQLPPGRYTREGFVPRITFRVGEGWTAQQVAEGFFDVQQDPGSLDVVAVQFGNVAGHRTAAEVITALAANSQLTVLDPQGIKLDGVRGTRVIVETTDPPTTQPPIFREVLSVTAGPISIASGRRLQLTLLDVPEGVLAVMVGGSVARWDHALEIATPVVETVEIGG